MNRMAAVTFLLATLLALPAYAMHGHQLEEHPAQQVAAAGASAEPETPGPVTPAASQEVGQPSGHLGLGDFGRVMGGALVGAAVGAGIGYYVVYRLGGPGLVTMIGKPIVTGGAVVGALWGVARATSRR